MSAHSKWSASSAERWINCPASVRLSEGVPKTQSEYAAEGAAAHWFAERCLRTGASARALLGKAPIYSERGRTFVLNPDMAEAIDLYCSVVQQEKDALGKHTQMSIEKKFSLDWLHDGLFGTADAVLVQRLGKAVVIDFKYGQGVTVSPQGNAQMMYYGLGSTHGGDCWDVDLVVVQPRTLQGEKVKRWATTVVDLDQWGYDLVLPAIIASKRPDAPAAVGDHCRWCPALSICPHQRRDLDVVAKAAGVSAMPDVSTMSGADMVKMMASCDAVERWIDAFRQHVRNLAGRGVDIPFKLVHGRMSRKWTDEQEVLRRFGGLFDCYDRKVISPAVCEKALRKAGLNPNEQMAGLVEVSSSQALVPIDDPRPRQLDAAMAFPELEP